MTRAPGRAEQSRRVYELDGYVACIQCGLPLRCTSGGSPKKPHSYYKDAARLRRLPCPAGGHLVVRTDVVRQQFGELLKGLQLPDNWREVIRLKMVEAAETVGIDRESMEREKERLKLKRSRILKQHRDGYLTDEELHGEMAAVELALRELASPDLNGVKFDEVIAAGERLPGMAALWDVATTEERHEIVRHVLEQGGCTMIWN